MATASPINIDVCGGHLNARTMLNFGMTTAAPTLLAGSILDASVNTVTAVTRACKRGSRRWLEQEMALQRNLSARYCLRRSRGGSTHSTCIAFLGAVQELGMAEPKKAWR